MPGPTSRSPPALRPNRSLGVAAYRKTAAATVSASAEGGSDVIRLQPRGAGGGGRGRELLAGHGLDREIFDGFWPGPFPLGTTSRTTAAGTGTGKISGVLARLERRPSRLVPRPVAYRYLQCGGAPLRHVLHSRRPRAMFPSPPTRHRRRRLHPTAADRTCEFDASGSHRPRRRPVDVQLELRRQRATAPGSRPNTPTPLMDRGRSP